MTGERPRALVEAALPLEAVNRRSVQESQGRISPLHLWWSRKPAAACRAALLGSLLPDPDDAEERSRLLGLVADAAAAPADGAGALGAAREALAAAWGPSPPTVLDPFSGSAAIAAEAQRLGLPAVASDLNPVAVLIGRALLEIPARFAERPAVHPGAPLAGRGRLAGLIGDVQHYGRRVGVEARRRIGAHYPAAPGGTPVIAWLWARTVRCPNPACGHPMPLVHSFHLSRRPGKEAWVVPEPGGGFRLGPSGGCPDPPEGTVNRRFAVCVRCGQRVPLPSLREHVRDGAGLGQTLLAMVAGSGRGRAYVPADAAHEAAGIAPAAAWAPDTDLPAAALGFAAQNYGITRHRDLYTPRQLLALTTFADLVGEARRAVEADARAAGMPVDGRPLRDGGVGAGAYAEAVSVYLAMALDRAAARWCTFARWHRTRDNIEHPFASPGLHMLWDFAEANPFSASTGNWGDAVDAVAAALALAPAHHAAVPAARCVQADAAAPPDPSGPVLVCTDPPYFDTLPYADMADLFYIWLRPVLRGVFPDLFATLLSPKADELIADPRRHGGAAAARAHFLARIETAFRRLRERADPRLPVTVFYAFREDAAGASAGAEGWEVVLTALIAAGLRITGTWPLRTEHAQRLRSRASNTLASSLLLVCRPRAADAPTIGLREWLRALRAELPSALRALAQAGVAPLDMAQAAIGPGMETFSRHAAVLDDAGPVGVAAALRWINEALDAHLAAETGDLDPATGFCLAWCARYGFEAGPFGEADVLARARDVAIPALAKSGAVVAESGRLRLRRPAAPTPAGPAAPESLWARLHAVMRALDEGGLPGAGRAFARGPGSTAALRSLAHRLFTLCAERGDPAAARAYAAAAASMEQIAAAAEGAVPV